MLTVITLVIYGFVSVYALFEFRYLQIKLARLKKEVSDLNEKTGDIPYLRRITDVQMDRIVNLQLAFKDSTLCLSDKVMDSLNELSSKLKRLEDELPFKKD